MNGDIRIVSDPEVIRFYRERIAAEGGFPVEDFLKPSPVPEDGWPAPSSNLRVLAARRRIERGEGPNIPPIAGE